MRSLAACIKKAGKALSGQDAEAIREIMAEGMSPAEAVDEYLTIMGEQRGSLIDEIVAQGGQVPDDARLYSRETTEQDPEYVSMDDIEFDPTLSGELQRHEREFAEFVTSVPKQELWDMYALLTEDQYVEGGRLGPEDTDGGKIISVDAFRELYDEYRLNRSMSAATHEPSSTMSKYYLRDYLAKPARPGTYILWQSGGTGAGKTSGLKLSLYHRDAGKTFDGNLAKTASVLKKWALVIQAGQFNVANHVIRDPIEAWTEGAIIRAINQEIKWGSGRNVPMDAHFYTHVGSANAMRELHTIMEEIAPTEDGVIVRMGQTADDMRQIKRDFKLGPVDSDGKPLLDENGEQIIEPPGTTKYEVIDNRNGKNGAASVGMDAILSYGDNKAAHDAAHDAYMIEGRQILDDIYENGHPRQITDEQGNQTGAKLSSKAYYGFLKQDVPEGTSRFHPNFHQGGRWFMEASTNGAVGPSQSIARSQPSEIRGRFERESGEGSSGAVDTADTREPVAPLYSRADGTAAVKAGELQLALAPAIRALAGTVRVNIVQSVADLPMDAVPTDVEGVYQGGDEIFLVADNLPTAARAKKVFAHETFGHLAMEQTPEFDDVLASVKNMLSMNNKAFTDAAAAVATTQGNLDEDTQAKEILAYMAENGVENGVMGRAVAAVRLALRRMGLLDGVDYSEAEIKALLVRAARDLVSSAEAKQKALAAMPLQEQILNDPTAVADVIMVAIKEIYANASMQDETLRIYAELQSLDPQRPEQAERAAELNEALYRAKVAPGLAPDVMDPEALYSRAYHGTSAFFDRFDINYMGTGEGFQAFGWGLYFSSERAVAEWYKNKLSGPAYAFKGKTGTKRTVKKQLRAAIVKATKKFAIKKPKSPGSSSDVSAGTIASGTLSMLGRHNGSLEETKAEISDQISIHSQFAENYEAVADDWAALRQDNEQKPDFVPVADATDWKGMAARERLVTAGWEAAYKFVSDGHILYEGNTGNLYEAEIPDNEDLLHYEDTINEHSPEVIEKIKAVFPELFEIQWIDTNSGAPTSEANLKYAQKLSEAELEERGFSRAVPAESMSGDTFYKWAGETLVERMQPGILNAMFQGFSGVIMRQTSDQIASKYLRDEAGIPGHSFIGAASDKLNYVIYDDSAIQITQINDTKVPIDEVAGAVNALFSRTGVQDETPERLAQPGKPFLVYRFGKGGGTLTNRNAGNASSVANRLATFDDYESPQSMNADADTVTVFEVKVDKFGTYQRFNAGRGDNKIWDPDSGGYIERPPMQGVGRDAGISGQVVSYAFGTDGYTAKKVGEMPLEGLREVLKKQFGYRSFDMSGGAVGARVLRDQTPAVKSAPGPVTAPGGQMALFSRQTINRRQFLAGVGAIAVVAAAPALPDIATTAKTIARNPGPVTTKSVFEIAGRSFTLAHRTGPGAGLPGRDLASGHLLVPKEMREGNNWGRWFSKDPTKALEQSKNEARLIMLQYAEETGDERLADDMKAELDGQAPGFTDDDGRSSASNKIRDRAMYSRKIHSDPAIEALRAKVLTPALEDITIRDRIRELVSRVTGIEWLGIKQGIVDSSASVEELEKGLFGGLLDASASAYKSMLATRNLGSVMAAIMHRGIPIYQNGVFTARTGRQGLIQIFEKITHHKEGNLLPLWELYAAAYRSQRLIQEKNPDGTSKEKVFTQEDIDKALSLGTQYPEFKTAFMEWQKFNSQLLDLAIKTGVINGEEAKVWRQNDYVPFYRAMEEIEYMGGQGPQTGREGIANVRSGIKRLTGSTAQIGNVFENMVMNTAYLTDAIYRNTAMQRVVAMADGVAMEKVPMAWEAIKFKDGDIARALMRAGLIVGNGSTEADMFNDGIRQVKAMTAEQKEHWSTLFRRVAPKGDNIVSVLIQGKPVYYEVQDPLLFRSLAAMGAQQWGGIMHTFRFAKRTLTRAVTIDPAFMLANFIRDTLSTAVITEGNGVTQIAGALKGLQAAWAEDPVMLDMMMAGAGGGGFYDHNPADVRRMLAKKMPAGQVDAFANSVLTPRGMWRFWQKIGNASEQANRIAVYRRVIAAGGTTAEAAYQARDVLNFTMAGDYNAMKFLVQTVPFLNARIQGLYRLYRGGKENPIGFAMKGLGITAATMALLLKNLDDDRFKALPEWDKDTYWHFFIGDEHFRLPKPFEVGAIFGTTFERAYMLGSGDDNLDITIERGWRMVLDTFAFNPVPQALKPMVEQYANRNMFTGNPIIGMHHEGMEPEAQYDPWTSETMRELAKLAPDGAPEWMRSPKRLEAFMRGYFGAAGMYALTASDSVTRRAFGHPSRPTRGLRNYPVVTRFWRDPAPRTSKYSSQLYDMLGEADAVYKTMNAYRDQHRVGEMAALLEGNRGKLHARKFLHDTAKQVSEINKNIRLVQFSNINPELKKSRIDRLNAAKLRVMSRVAAVSDIF